MENKDLLSLIMARPGITLMVTGEELLVFANGLINETLNAFRKLNESKAKETWLTTAEATKYLGVSASTLCRWTQRGKLHPRRIGANYRFSESELLAIRDEDKKQIT